MITKDMIDPNWKDVVLGLDISKFCGWAIWETERSTSSIVCGVLEFPDDATIEFCADQMALKIKKLITGYREQYAYIDMVKDEDGVFQPRKFYARKINLVVMETALKMSPNKDARSIVSSCMLHGAVLSTLSLYGVAWATMAVGTWRKHFFPKGFKPEPSVVTDRFTGEKKSGSPDWKSAAVARCQDRDLGITLPTKKALAHNAAEGCALALMWPHATVQPRYQPVFMKMLQSRHKRERVPHSDRKDLFSGAAA